MMRCYVLSTIEGCLISSSNHSWFFQSDEVFSKFVKFSATLCGLFADQPLVQYQWGLFTCLSARVVNTSFYVNILFCAENHDSDGEVCSEFDVTENKVSKYIIEVILYFFGFPFINSELVRISKSIELKCSENLEHGNKVTDINSDINDVIMDEIDDARLLLDNFEEHYVYLLLHTHPRDFRQFEADIIPSSTDYIAKWYQPLLPTMKKHPGWSINVFICIHEGAVGYTKTLPASSVASFYVPAPDVVALRFRHKSDGSSFETDDDNFYGYLLCNATAVSGFMTVYKLSSGSNHNLDSLCPLHYTCRYQIYQWLLLCSATAKFATRPMMTILAPTLRTSSSLRTPQRGQSDMPTVVPAECWRRLFWGR
jgi:hypothetical protein